jgi:3-oxoacyl-[acyl-carrier protein] reductase
MSSDIHSLAGQTAWVTGSSRGIGKVVATHLASLGAKVAVHGTTPTSARAFGEGESLHAVAAGIAADCGAETLPVYGDLTQEADVHRIAEEIRAKWGLIDILVCVAGGDIGVAGTSGAQGGRPQGNDPIHMSVEDIRTVLDRNIMTCILCCREVAPEMMERKSGRIVTTGSIAGLYGRPEGAIYGTAKAAVHQYTRALATQLRPYNVCVNCIAPGDIVTPRLLATRHVEPERLIEDGTLVRCGRPMEIARLVEYLVTPANTFLTGQVLRIDGGSQAWPA